MQRRWPPCCGVQPVESLLDYLRGAGVLPLLLAWCAFEGVKTLGELFAWLRKKHGKGAGNDK